VHADLSQLAGWHAQLEAAERLTRSGAIEPQQWFAIYTSRVPAASGGVWDRVAAVQALDAALLAGERRRMWPAACPRPSNTCSEAGLTVAFATIFAERLQRVPLTGDAGLLARRIGLLSSDVRAHRPIRRGPERGRADGVRRRARPAVSRRPARRSRHATRRGRRVLRDAAPHGYQWFLDNDRMGEAFLRAALVLSDREGDPGDIGDALILLREVGFEDVARRAALQLLLDRAEPWRPGSDSDWISAFLEAQAAERGAARTRFWPMAGT
jgi:hypothetical protein